MRFAPLYQNFWLRAWIDHTLDMVAVVLLLTCLRLQTHKLKR